MKFEYDPAKSAGNLIKHGIDFEKAQELWNSKTIELESKAYVSEHRTLVLGKIEGKHWTAIVTERGDATRIISVRRSRQKEARYYDETN
ncbi:BrnT family toxin [Eggerthella sp. YY7918]|uniref:BrnT family toxin n=1 Tax=Eggerthella sp. (strain YY7918) TaxID=502558 RepID=UPI00021718CE|nr:BrnT family toxin [Eggerthella sp. YY7918]BAK45129.1 uncharacterized BCR [Eggerthella sp. YY7918]